jgi:hypothetical protein
MAFIDYRQRWAKSPLQPAEACWWTAIEEASRWERV